VVLEMQTEIKAENPKSRMSGPMRALIEVFEAEQGDALGAAMAQGSPGPFRDPDDRSRI